MSLYEICSTNFICQEPLAFKLLSGKVSTLITDEGREFQLRLDRTCSSRLHTCKYFHRVYWCSKFNVRFYCVFSAMKCDIGHNPIWSIFSWQDEDYIIIELDTTEKDSEYYWVMRRCSENCGVKMLTFKKTFLSGIRLKYILPSFPLTVIVESSKNHRPNKFARLTQRLLDDSPITNRVNQNWSFECI